MSPKLTRGLIKDSHTCVFLLMLQNISRQFFHKTLVNGCFYYLFILTLKISKSFDPKWFSCHFELSQKMMKVSNRILKNIGLFKSYYHNQVYKLINKKKDQKAHAIGM